MVLFCSKDLKTALKGFEILENLLHIFNIEKTAFYDNRLGRSRLTKIKGVGKPMPYRNECNRSVVWLFSLITSIHIEENSTVLVYTIVQCTLLNMIYKKIIWVQL